MLAMEEGDAMVSLFGVHVRCKAHPVDEVDSLHIWRRRSVDPIFRSPEVELELVGRVDTNGVFIVVNRLQDGLVHEPLDLLDEPLA